MDLAKIRKKSLLTPKEADDAPISTVPSSLEPIKITPETTPVSSEMDFFQNETCYTAVPSMVIAPQLPPVAHQERVAVTCNPLEVILAGRSAAGCDDESSLADEVTSEIVTESRLEFLCFRVSNEIYGINIMDIKEIIKPREVTEVPRAPVFVSGVLSLRGTIIPIIDMRIRLGLAQEKSSGKERIVVIKNNNSFSGLLVDEVTQVVQVHLEAVEAAPAILDGIDRDFVSGIGRSGGRFIIILNLGNVADINLY